MHVARSLATLVVALGAVLGLASTASAATCAGSGYLVTKTGTLQRFSTNTNAVTSTFSPSGSFYADVAVAPNGLMAYAVDRDANSVSVINATTNTISETINAPGTPLSSPNAIALSPDGTRAYIVNKGNDTITVINTTTNTPVGVSHVVDPSPTDAVVSADGSVLYVTADNKLTAWSTADWSPLTTYPFTGTGASVTRTATTAYTAVISASHSVVAAQLSGSNVTIPYTGLTGQPQTVALSPDNSTLYIGTDASGAQSLLAVNLPSGGAPTPVGSSSAQGVFSIATSPDGSTIYAGGETGVAVLTNGGTVAGTLASGPSARTTAIATCPAVVPGIPTAVIADPGDTVASVSWTAPADTGGAPITRYTATASPGGATCTTTGATTCLFTGLKNGTAYTFTVTATNVAGTSAASTASTKVTPRKDNRARVLTLGPATVTYTKKGVGVAFNVTTTSAGVIAAAMTYKGDRYCNVSKRVTAAGTYRVKCVMKAAGRALARKRTTTYTLNATFSPTNGPLASAKPSVVVKRRR